MGNFEYIALAVLVAFCVYLFTRSNKISKKFNEINNELIKYQTLDENKIDLDNESYPFNKTLKELEETIEKIVTSYEGYLTTREGFNTKLDDLKNVTSRLNLTLSSNQKRGNWGEIQVEKILEDSGLVKGQNFETQKLQNLFIPLLFDLLTKRANDYYQGKFLLKKAGLSRLVCLIMSIFQSPKDL